jgi:protein-disulfide isomerase
LIRQPEGPPMTPLTRRLSLLAAAAAVAIGLALPAEAQITGKQKGEIEAIIKEYLLKNPEVLRDALNELEKRQRDAETKAQKKALDEQKEALFNDPRAIVVGNPKGDVTIVEFFDYNCGYCKRSIADLDKLITADPKLRIVLKDFPILGPDSVAASRIAVAAQAQLPPEKYWDFHRRLMLETKGRIGKDAAIAVAKSFGLDVKKLEADADSEAVEGRVRQIMDIADALGINGTPAFVIGDRVIAGAVGVTPMAQAIASARKCGKAEC